MTQALPHDLGPAAAEPIRAERGESLLRRRLSAYFDTPLAFVGAGLLVLLLVVAIAAPWIAPQNPYDLAQLDIMDGRLAPGEKAAAGFTYYLGTDEQGRDMLSAILYGLRISLFVGVVSTLFACTIGASIGVAAAYAGGKVESFVMRVVDLQLS